MVVGSALALLALVPSLELAYVLLFFGGSAMAMNAITTNTLLQTGAPPDLRGRVIGVYAFLVVGLAPVGALQAGWVSEGLGVRAQAAVGGLLCLVVTGWVWARMRRLGPAEPLLASPAAPADPEPGGR
jgi:MFS family permease